jgi:hypothetical protein
MTRKIMAPVIRHGKKTGIAMEFDCFPEWQNDGDCDCGCQFDDHQDCCGVECDFCWFYDPEEDNCPPEWEFDDDCDCGCQFLDEALCAGGCVLTSSVPAYFGNAPYSTLSRTKNNIIHLYFDCPITAAAGGQFEIREMLPGGAFGATNLFSSFTVQVDGIEFILREDGEVLTDGKWYAIMNNGTWPGIAPFKVEFPVQPGDGNNDGLVNFADLSLCNTFIPTFSPIPINRERCDVNADGLINFADLSTANTQIPAFVIPKPAGHCPCD